jgi:hypothetical protein
MNGDDGAMRLNGPPGSAGRLRNGFTLFFVRADWISSVASIIRRGLHPELRIAPPGPQFWLLLCSAIFDSVWLAGWLIIAIRFHFPIGIFFASFPVLKWLLLLVARQPGESETIQEPLSATVKVEPTSVFEPAPRHGAA